MIVFDRNGTSCQTVLQDRFQALGHGGARLASANDIDVCIVAQIVGRIGDGEDVSLPYDRMLYGDHGIDGGNPGVKNAPGVHFELLESTCHDATVKNTCSIVFSVFWRSGASAFWRSVAKYAVTASRTKPRASLP